ncbi:unnamed protein product [Cuscuta campestris]|uniref:Uncharacterized protein n=1 Tax=Cuscuta campestris TaxID=132261 RepID=A0A484NJT6_9ASTE|nr:unnamed protein product [Cuscuta campestris]
MERTSPIRCVGLSRVCRRSACWTATSSAAVTSAGVAPPAAAPSPSVVAAATTSSRILSCVTVKFGGDDKAHRVTFLFLSSLQDPFLLDDGGVYAIQWWQGFCGNDVRS